MGQQSSSNPAQIYEQYFVPAIFVPSARGLLEHAAPRTGEQVLDVACGSGVVARTVAPLVGTEGKVVALDMNPDMLTVARALPAPTGPLIEWREGDALALPDGPFDLVLCQHGLQFFPDPAAAVSEMRRVLKVDGRVVLNVWQPLHLHVVYETLLETTARHLDATVAALAHAWSLGDAEELRVLFDAAGFQGTEICQVSLPVRFPSPERFVELTILAGATTIPAFAQLDATERSALVETVKKETEEVLQRYREEETVAFPMFAHIAVAHA
jgi:SAM-dependent methyltransferase